MAGLSFANLIFFQSWHELLYAGETYFSSKDPRPEALALYANVLLTGAFLLLLLRLARSSGPPWLRGGAVWSMVVLAVLIYRPLSWEAWLAGRYGPLAPVLLIALPLAVLVLLRHRLLSAGRGALLCVAPFVLATFGHAAFLLVPQASQGPPLPLPARADAPRVLWVILDELDYGVAFPERPQGVALPELDRLVGEGLSATHAVPPANDTRLSIPALVSGRMVQDARYSATREMRITFAGEGRPLPWSAAPSVFSRARAAGFNSAAYGWYFPYCWLFQHMLVACEWAEFSTMQAAREQRTGIAASMAAQWSQLAHRVLSVGEFSLLARRPLEAGLSFAEARERVALARRIGGEFRRKRHREMLASVITAANDPRLGLVYAHFGVPHPPGMYDRNSGELRDGGGYLDNLVLADRIVGEVRRAMEKAGTWDRTTVIVTSDHAFRRAIWEAEMTEEDKALFSGAPDARVPFLARFPEKHPVVYEREFNTVVSADLVLEILQGKIRSPEEAVVWLDRRVSR